MDVISENQYIRTYSEALHDEDYKELAKGFARKDPKGKRKVVSSEKIKSLKVVWKEEVINKKAKTRKMTVMNKVFKPKYGTDWKADAIKYANKVSERPGQFGSGTVVWK